MSFAVPFQFDSNITVSDIVEGITIGDDFGLVTLSEVDSWDLVDGRGHSVSHDFGLFVFVGLDFSESDVILGAIVNDIMSISVDNFRFESENVPSFDSLEEMGVTIVVAFQIFNLISLIMKSIEILFELHLFRCRITFGIILYENVLIRQVSFNSYL